MRNEDEIWKEILLGKSLGRPVNYLYVELKYLKRKNMSIVLFKCGWVTLLISGWNIILSAPDRLVYLTFAVGSVGISGAVISFLSLTILEHKECKQIKNE